MSSFGDLWRAARSVPPLGNWRGALVRGPAHQMREPSVVRRPLTAYLLIAALAAPVVFATFHAARTSEPLGKDAVRSFAYVHSIVFDRDFDFHNQFVETYPKYAAAPWFVEETGRAPNWKPIGPALFWLPTYLLVVLLGIDPTGLGPASRAACVLVSAAMVSLATLASFSLARNYTRFPGFSAAVVSTGSFFLFYWLYPDLTGHSIAIGVSALYVWLWHRTLDDQRWHVWLVLGLVGGLVAIVRWQNVVLPVLSIGWKIVRAPRERTLLIGLAVFAVAFAVAFAPQLLAWRAVYGRWLTVPQGSFMHWDKPYLLDTLFSPRYGLLGFSPALYLGVIGLVMGARRWREPLLSLGLVYFVVSVYVNASAGDWYAGDTFGPRRMDSLFAFLVVGTSIALDGISRQLERRPDIGRAVALGAACLATVILIGGYRTGRINRGMVGAHEFPFRAWEVVIDSAGWPPSLPAELWHKIRSGTRLGQYSQLAHDDRLTWLDGVVKPTRSHLGNGWDITDHLTAELASDSGRIYLYLMDLGFHYRDIRVHVDITGPRRELRRWRRELRDGTALRVNGQAQAAQASIALDGEIAALTAAFTVQYPVLRAGVNYLDLVGEGIVLREVRLEAIP